MSENTEARPDIANETPLQGWKEIAVFLDRDESTARRWERESGLPVRRHTANRRSSVYAYPSELKAWRDSRPVALAAEATPDSPKEGSWRWAAVAAALLLVGLIAFARSSLLGPVAEAQSPAAGVRTTEVCANCNLVHPIGTVSPDGRWFSQTDWTESRVTVTDIASGELQAATPADAEGSTWRTPYWHVFSPDSAYVAFDWATDDRRYTQIRKLAVTEPDGEFPLLYANKDFRNIDVVGWSPSDEILILGHRADWTTVVGFVPADGGELRVIKTIPSNSPRARLSPDGNWIAYDMASKDHAPRRDVYLLAADGSRETRVTSHEANDYVMGFTPGSEALLFSSNRSGSYSLWASSILPDGGTARPRLIHRDMGPAAPLSMGSDGAMYFVRSLGALDIFTAEIDWQSGRVEAEPIPVEGMNQGANSVPIWSPDGRFLLYRAAEATGDLPGSVVRLVLRSWPDGKEREIVPSGIELETYYRMALGPDGKRVMARAMDNRARWGLYTIDLETSDTELLERSSGLGWDREGESWFYVQKREIHRVDPGADVGKRIYSFPSRFDGLTVRLISLSPQRSHVAFAVIAEDQKQIWVEPLEGGEERMLFDASEDGWVPSLEWTPDGEALLAVITAPEAAKGIYRFPIDGSPAVKTELLGDRVANAVLHPDGRTVAYQDGSPSSRTWKMENFWKPAGGSSTE